MKLIEISDISELIKIAEEKLTFNIGDTVWVFLDKERLEKGTIIKILKDNNYEISIGNNNAYIVVSEFDDDGNLNIIKREVWF